MTDEQKLIELKRRMDADDPNALFEYAELVRPTDPVEGRKYTVLAAQLGHPNAMELMGDECYAKGDMINAAIYYKAGAKAGLLDCTVKLNVINLSTHEHAALFELEELAQMGITSAIAALADYYKKRGNRKESAYWRSLLK